MRAPHPFRTNEAAHRLTASHLRWRCLISREVGMAENSMWSTWKPYAVIVVLAIAGFWWWNSQSSFAALKDGSYACQGVYVNDENKYEVLVDDAGNRLLATARVSGGDLVSLEGDTPMSAAQVASLTVRTKGDSHFHATDDPAMRMYYAIACDYRG